MLIYCSGPYTAYIDIEGKIHDIDDNIDVALTIAAEVWKAGHYAICPHGNTAHFEVRYPDISYRQYIAGDLEILKVCDAILMLPDYLYSQGAKTELQMAHSLGMPEYIYPCIPPMHITEQRCPKQVKAFRAILGQMYRTHLKKNADYSPANILGTGEVGVVTRLWDKTARLMNLTGFNIALDTPVEFSAPKNPQNESIDDTYLDLAVYSIIGKLLRSGDWGK
jgi:hypothetical protein